MNAYTRFIHRLCIIEDNTRPKYRPAMAIGERSRTTAHRGPVLVGIAENSAFINDDEIVDAEILPDNWRMPQTERP